MYGVLINDPSEQGMQGVKVEVVCKIPHDAKFTVTRDGDTEEYEFGVEGYILKGIERTRGAVFSYNGVEGTDVSMVSDVSLFH